jgi:hypothetical protein
VALERVEQAKVKRVEESERASEEGRGRSAGGSAINGYRIGTFPSPFLRMRAYVSSLAFFWPSFGQI